MATLDGPSHLGSDCVLLLPQGDAHEAGCPENTYSVDLETGIAKIDHKSDCLVR
eukprot:SAG31_NODE_14544_length_800_cov_1.251070_1_plen_53_part_10